VKQDYSERRFRQIPRTSPSNHVPLHRAPGLHWDHIQSKGHGLALRAADALRFAPRAADARRFVRPKISVSRDSFGERNVREDSGLIRPALGHRKMEMGRLDMAARPI
jgi:hypothetical protein